MVRREISEFKNKLHPNEKLRAWYASHTFGGTTKSKSLKILGFSKVNFYYIAGAVGALVLIAAVAGGIGVKRSLQSAEAGGAKQGLPGQQFVQSTTNRRTRTLISNGQTIITTETTAYLTTIQRGAGTTRIKTTNDQGKEITVPASLSLFTNSAGKINTRTFIATSIFVTDSNSVAEETFIYGEPTVISSDGTVITTTRFDGLTIGTNENGQTVTSFSPPVPTPDATTTNTSTSTDSAGSTKTSPGSDGESPTGATATTTDTTNAPLSTSEATSTISNSRSLSRSPTPSRAASSTASGGENGGGGEEFEGEATFYAPGLGSCGTDATDADFVAALSKVLFDATGATNSNNNPYCGRKALVKAASSKRRRWEGIGNITGEGEHWEKTRHERWSRRSAVSIGRGLEVPTQSRNESDHGSEADSAAVPGITPPPNMGPWRRQAGAGGVTITIVDRCPVCKQYDLDLSPAAYNVLGNPDAGRIPIKWKWLD